MPMYGPVKTVLIIAVSLTLLLACSQNGERAPVKRVYTGKSVNDFAAASLRADQYRVEKGDTLYSIAFRANVDIRQIAQMNQLVEPFTIYPGQTLTLRSADSKSKTEQSSARAQRRGQTSGSGVASDENRGYVKPESKQKVSNSNAIVLPRAVESYPKSNAIVWQWPTRNAVISNFSVTEAGNKGIDFAGTNNAPVYAAAAGKVVYAGNALKGYGNLIILKHNDDYITAYAHNSQLLVKEQDWVQVGDEIAKMGNTDAERFKLHFEIRFRGKSVNPRHYLPKEGE